MRTGWGYKKLQGDLKIICMHCKQDGEENSRLLHGT